MYQEKKDDIEAALWSDLRKCKSESLVMELDFLINDIKNTLFHIYSWAKPEYVEKDIANILDAAYVQREPFGVALIIGKYILFIYYFYSNINITI